MICIVHSMDETCARPFLGFSLRSHPYPGPADRLPAAVCNRLGSWTGDRRVPGLPGRPAGSGARRKPFQTAGHFLARLRIYHYGHSIGGCGDFLSRHFLGWSACSACPVDWKTVFPFLSSSQPVPDTILFVIFAGLGFWLISVLAGYTLTNGGDFIAAVVPSGIILFIIQLYDSSVGDSVIILAIYAFLCLLLLGRLTYVHKRIFWKAQRVSFSAESWTDINIAIPVAAFVLNSCGLADACHGTTGGCCQDCLGEYYSPV